MNSTPPRLHTATFMMGVTGAGKNTQIKKILEKYPHLFAQCLSTKTRGFRPGEKDGVDFHKLSVEEFLQKIKEGYFLEWMQDPETLEYYGTSMASLYNTLQRFHAIKELEPIGFKDLLDQSPNFLYKGIFIDVPDDVIAQRAHERGGMDEEELPKRLVKSQTERKLIAELLVQGAPITVLNGNQPIASVTRRIEDILMAFPDNRKRHNRE
ncbi:MAG: hypothetical protein WC004_02125 [Candidatus Absconditabacterales bacterium]